MNLKDDLLYPVLGVILKSALWSVSRVRLPQTKGKLELDGLNSPVEVMRDRWGMVHIYASSARDCLFAQGFVHAQERLWQMDFNRRVIAGRLAEILGEAGLPADRAMRTLSLYQTAEEEARLVPGYLAPLLAAYCDGVNASIDNTIQKRKLPVEFILLGYKPEHWQMADIFKWVRLMCWTLAGNWQSEFYRGELIHRLGAEKVAQLEIDIDKAWAVILDAGKVLAGDKVADATRRITGPHAGAGVGSNNWVVHGSRTKNGKPLLANDMHLALTTPGVWFENHLKGGELDVTGVGIPGVPLVIAGHNHHVAWGYTDSLPDAQDLYEEHLHRTSEGRWEYEFQGEWHPAIVRQEEIKIKGGKTTTEEVVVTRHGPIINLLLRDAFPEAPPLALRWTTLEAGRTCQAIYEMNLAQNCKAFHQALRFFDDPSQNIVFADTQGNIGYTMFGRVPIRAKGDGSTPSPGWAGEYEWTGYIPFDELPHLENPPGGFIATANNQIQRQEYPHFLSRDYLTSERAGRITELLESNTKIDIAYTQAMQYDQVSISARLLGRCLGNLQDVDPDLQPVVTLMRNWDGKMGANRPEAAIFEITISHAIQLLLKHWLGELGLKIQGRGPFCGQWPEHTWEWFIHLLEKPDSPWFNLGNGETRDDVLRLGLRQGVDYLKKELGPNISGWKWGRLHRLMLGHVLGAQKPLDRVFNIGSFPMGGDGNTVWATFTSWVDHKDKEMVGPPFRFIADLNDLDHCLGQLIPGESGHLASRHYRDGIKPWLTGEYHPMLFQRSEVEQHLEALLMLEKKT